MKLLQVFRVCPQDIASPSIYRSINVIGSILLSWTVCRLLVLIKAENNSCESDEASTSSPSLHLTHTAINVCLFPCLFFFYGLHYTDVLSALSVLFAYQCYLEERKSWNVVLAALFSLLFRQTNIFWGSLFLGGLAFCRALSKSRPGADFPIRPTFYEVISSSWQHACVYDPPFSQASFEGFVLLTSSGDMR